MSNLIYYKPYTASMRHMCLLNNKVTNQSYKLSTLLYNLKNVGGRNNYGHITIRRRRRKASRIDFITNSSDVLDNVRGCVIQLNYSPRRSSFVALVKYSNGVYNYILAFEGIQINDIIRKFKLLPELLYNGNMSTCLMIPSGALIYNIESYPNHGGVYSKASGACSLLVNKINNRVIIKLKSKKLKNLSNNCSATIGRVGNCEKKLTVSGKAGRSFHLGRRPHVRGVAMNPVDHPHGGGEGRKSKPRCPKNPFGKRMKWNKTRKKKLRKHDSIPV